MNSSPREALSNLFEKIIEWRRCIIPNQTNFNWSDLHISVVHSYVLNLDFKSDLKVLSYPYLFSCLRFSDEKSATLVTDFVQDLEELFVVPRLHQLSIRENTLKKTELVAAFMNFLLHLLYHKTDLVVAFEDRIDNLEKELRFLITVVGDTIFLCDEDEQVENLLVEFEVVANKAGSLVHSFFFSMDPIFQTIAECLAVLLKQIDLLRNNISEFTFLQPILAKANPTPKTVAVDSLFIVDSLLGDLEDLLNQDDSPIADVKGQIKVLHQELMISLSFLKYNKVDRLAEMEQLKEAGTRIRGVAYEAEYLISSFLVGDAPLWYLSVRLPDVIHKSKLIRTRIQEIQNNFAIRALKVAEDLSAQLPLQAKRNFEVDDITVGFEENATDILDELVGGREQLQIISIFGMPGLGKTTFAKKLFNHPSVNYRFDKRSWCVVSQTYQRKLILIDVLISLRAELNKVKEMEEENIVEHIYKSLKGRRYLIVMDDIWDLNAWDDLRRCFPNDGNGSRILFTTRNKDVAPPNSIIHALPSLSTDQCWELLKKKVFHHEPCPAQLQGIGKEIAANCVGLPLAVVVIAGILSTMDKEESTWKNVGRNIASYIFYGGDDSVMQILELSYKHLPDHLKPCFLYFGAYFLEGTEIPARKLIRLWIAEGFIHKEQNKSRESVAEEYLMELIDKSLVMVAKRRSDGGVKACVIHDLLRDLCLKLSEEANFLKLVVDDNYILYHKGLRLLSLQCSPTPFGHHVRSFHSYRLKSALYLPNMKLVRVLNFKEMYPGVRLIGTEFLVQLRYLVINELPQSIGSLVNLECLMITGSCVYIPSVIVRMKKLRYLGANAVALNEDCNSSQTNNLEFLSVVHFKNLKDEEMLKYSPNLRKVKCICEPSQYRYPDLRFLIQLESFNITLYPKYFLSRNETTEINFPSNIKKLTLNGLCLPWEKMSMIGGLPNLEVLKLKSGAFVGEQWDTKDGEFQKLRFLKLYEIYMFTQWNVPSSEHFPKLQRLVFRDCYNLQEIPSVIGEIETLQSIEVESCLKSLARSAKKIEQDQRDMGNEELRVVIGHIFRDGGHKSNDDDDDSDDNISQR